MVKLITKISDYILKSEKRVKKKVSDVMGGKVLELESERLIRIGKAEGKAEGLAEGLAEGKAEGESLLGELITRLIASGRNEEIEMAAKDDKIRKELYREFGLKY